MVRPVDPGGTFDLTETRNQRVAAEILGSIGDATMTDGHGCYSKKKHSWRPCQLSSTCPP